MKAVENVYLIFINCYYKHSFHNFVCRKVIALCFREKQALLLSMCKCWLHIVDINVISILLVIKNVGKTQTGSVAYFLNVFLVHSNRIEFISLTFNN